MEMENSDALLVDSTSIPISTAQGLLESGDIFVFKSSWCVILQ